MRLLRSGPLMLAILLLGCGDDPFTVDDALGVWDLRQLNATELSGDTPRGVTVRDAGGSDSTVTVLRSLRLTFSPGSRCSWTVDDGLSGPVTQDDCGYAVAPDGTVTLEFVNLFGADRSVTGTARAGILTLTDQDTNVFAFHRGG